MTTARSLRVLMFGAAVLLGAALGYGGYLLSRLAPIGTGYAAKVLCSAVFVAGRPAAQVIEEDIRAEQHPLLQFIWPTVDLDRRVTSATFLGFARREAVYRPALGCVLMVGDTSPGAALAANGGTVTRSVTPVHAGEAQALGAELKLGFDAARLNSVLDEAFTEPNPHALRRTRAVVVMHRGRVIAERYAPGFSASMPMPGWSMSKSVCAALVGVAVQQGRLAVESNALLPEWWGPGDPRAAITLDQLLRMTSGLQFSEDYADPLADVVVMLFTQPNGPWFAASKPLAAPPGTHWQYSSGNSAILARVLRIALGGTDAEYLEFPRRALFDPIGMRSAVLEVDASGALQTSSFVYASPHDWARFGQFLLQDGVWNGKRLLPQGWVRYLTTLTPSSRRQDYGAHIWVRVPEPFNSTQAEPPRLPDDAFHLAGYDGQLTSIVPSRELVVVRLGVSRSRRAWDHEAFLARVLDASP